MVGESRATWFSRIWSWNPTASWDMVKEKVDAEIVPVSTATIVDFEDENKTDNYKEVDSFKRYLILMLTLVLNKSETFSMPLNLDEMQ